MKEIYLQNNCLVIYPDANQISEIIIKKIYNVIKNSNTNKIKINLTDINMLDAIKIATFISAKGLISDTNKEYEFMVKDKIVLSYMKLFSLNNCKITVEENSILYKISSKS